jgi:LacI family transcriptional regulator
MSRDENLSITIERIAEQAGVSASTVARVLRGDFKGAQQRSIEKAKEIQRISQELGYRPNWRARALSRGQTRTIGLLYSNPMWIFEDPMNEIAVGFTEALQEQGYDLRLIPVHIDQHWEELVYGGAVDGVAALVSTPQAVHDVIADGRVPVVLIGDVCKGVPHVVSDDESGAYLATRHLLGLGHKHIVYYVSDTIRKHYSVDARRTGYERAMREAGLADFTDNWHIDDEELTCRLLSPNRPTAIIGYCHVEALRIVHAAWSHGLTIPNDLSLISFNDMPMTRYMTPPLTVVGFDTMELGRVGAKMLIRKIQQKPDSEPESVVLRQRIIVRNTTARPLRR